MKKLVSLVLICGGLAAALFFATKQPQTTASELVQQSKAAVQNLSDEEQVRQRSQQRWDAMLKFDMERVYSFATPQYRRTFNLAHLNNQYGGQVNRLGVAVESVEIKDSTPPKANVAVIIDFETEGFGQGPLRLQNRTEETWIKLNGQWWFIEPR